jgi:hypothetical protein
MSWKDDQEWEKNWWGNCTNTYGEEQKQLLYASKMGLPTFHDKKSPYNLLVSGKILDIGGGPVSLLLKSPNATGKVVDPCEYPQWVHDRYKLAGIEYQQVAGEDIDETGYDEVWVYNVLQHTKDPKKIIDNAKKAGKIIRLFEWINTKISKGHPHSFTAVQLDGWLNGKGKTEMLNGQSHCFGECYYGIFLGNAYGT